MTVLVMRSYLGECFGECLKHIGAIETAVKVDVELSSEVIVGQMTQLCVCGWVCSSSIKGLSISINPYVLLVSL